MSVDPAPSFELRARIRLTRNAIARLWHGGILSLTVEGTSVAVHLKLHCSEVCAGRGTHILITPVSAE